MTNLDDLKWQKFEVHEFHEMNSNLIEFLLAILEPFFLKLRFTFLSNFGWPTAESILAQKIKLFHKFTFWLHMQTAKTSEIRPWKLHVDCAKLPLRMFYKANGLTGRTFRQWISTFKEIKGIITKQINFPAVAWKKIRNNRCKRRYITAKGAESIELKATKIVPTNYGKCCVVGIQILTSQILSSIGVAVVRCGRQNVFINATQQILKLILPF